MLAFAGVAALLWLPAAQAEDAAEWLRTAANAAQQLNYMGTLVYQHGRRVETSRLLHMVDKRGEHEKLINLDGPAREVIRNNDEVRCYYPDAKIIRIEPRTYRNAFPSLLPQQLETLAEYYFFRKAEVARIAGVETPGVRVRTEGRHALRPQALGGPRDRPAAQGAAPERAQQPDRAVPVHGHRDRRQDRSRKRAPDLPAAAADWQTRESLPGDVVPQDTGWQVKQLPPGFAKIVEGFRTLRGKAAPVAHLVFSDGLVAVSVFVEPMPQAPQPVGPTQQGGINVYSRQLDEHLVTVLGETPGATVRQIAFSVAHR